MIRLTPVSGWTVYALEDGKGVPFYIGMTRNLAVRVGQHLTAEGAVLNRIRELEVAGHVVRARVVAECHSEAEARWRELAEMRRHPGLVNRVGYGRTTVRSAAVEQLLAPISLVIGRGRSGQPRTTAIRALLEKGLKP